MSRFSSAKSISLRQVSRSRIARTSCPVLTTWRDRHWTGMLQRRHAESAPHTPMSASDTDVAGASRRYFNQWATRYDDSWAQIWFRENHRLIVQAMDPPADARILDLGCGTGQLAARLAQRVP